ncbi:MAG: hypothetical protein LBD53_03645 [Tannerella sp.]|nr:hypothetical protein [Tannerella sp.]
MGRHLVAPLIMTHRAFVIARNEAIQRKGTLDCFVPRNDVVPSAFCRLLSAFCYLPSAFCLLLSANRLQGLKPLQGFGAKNVIIFHLCRQRYLNYTSSAATRWRSVWTVSNSEVGAAAPIGTLSLR